MATSTTEGPWQGWDNYHAPLTRDEQDCNNPQELAGQVLATTKHDPGCSHYYDWTAPADEPTGHCSCDYGRRTLFRYAHVAKMRGF